MCLLIDTKIHGTSLKAAVADKDITVYKVLKEVERPWKPIDIYDSYKFSTSPFKTFEDKFMTPYQGALVDFNGGSTYLLKADSFPTEKSDSGEINNGIHAYQTLEIAQKQTTFTTKTWVFKALIPAGIPFYVGADGDIVAEELIIERFLGDNESKDYRIPEWLEEKNELQNKLKITLECIDEMTEKLQALKKEVVKAEAEEYKAKKAYDRGFEAGRKQAWRPKREQLEALQMALVRAMGDGLENGYHNLQSLFYDLQKLFSEK